MMVWAGMTSQSVVMTGGLSSPPKATIADLRHAAIPGTNLSLVHDSAGPSHLHDRRSSSLLGLDNLTDDSGSGVEDAECCHCPCHARHFEPKNTMLPLRGVPVCFNCAHGN
ncbi:hypothetical protein PoB_005265500 [Plakobranchus ocellatus]|uniref:Uncharacterized protein n=1 Tax=Plakobranchus ocellatus TaxID=259542 RepID=A0AAV4C3E8_9GAST|nr:hypothetical protein PoB_005265500 [Plakobranchus ocellatus]